MRRSPNFSLLSLKKKDTPYIRRSALFRSQQILHRRVDLAVLKTIQIDLGGR